MAISIKLTFQSEELLSQLLEDYYFTERINTYKWERHDNSILLFENKINYTYQDFSQIILNLLKEELKLKLYIDTIEVNPLNNISYGLFDCNKILIIKLDYFAKNKKKHDL